MLLLDLVHLLAFIETPESVQVANSSVERPTQVLLMHVTVTRW
jgi:hypothetical protein